MAGKGSASTYIPTGAAEYSSKHKVPKSQGKCATFVKNSITSKGAGAVNDNIYFGKVDACTCSAWMPWFGFQIVCSGDTKNCPDGFEPLDGDIMVNAGLANVSDKTKYGHISVYDNETKQWIADFASNGPGCYPPETKRNYWVIFRK